MYILEYSDCQNHKHTIDKNISPAEPSSKKVKLFIDLPIDEIKPIVEAEEFQNGGESDLLAMIVFFWLSRFWRKDQIQWIFSRFLLDKKKDQIHTLLEDFRAEVGTNEIEIGDKRVLTTFLSKIKLSVYWDKKRYDRFFSRVFQWKLEIIDRGPDSKN